MVPLSLYAFTKYQPIFIAQCYAERGMLRQVVSPSVRPSVRRDVEVSWTHRLDFFEKIFTVS